MNAWLDVVDSFKIKAERFEAARRLTDGRIGARANRGRVLSPEKIDALIWGLAHANPVVRRCCLEFLDQHPADRAIAPIIECLGDPVARVRWHAVHALICDGCKPGTSYLTGEILDRIRQMAESDPSPKVRNQARLGS